MRRFIIFLVGLTTSHCLPLENHHPYAFGPQLPPPIHEGHQHSPDIHSGPPMISPRDHGDSLHTRAIPLIHPGDHHVHPGNHQPHLHESYHPHHEIHHLHHDVHHEVHHPLPIIHQLPIHEAHHEHHYHQHPIHIQPEHQAYPLYDFGYNIFDPHTGDIKNQHEHRNGEYVRGTYSFVEPDGLRRIVDYSSDPLKGFNAIVRHEPVGHGHGGHP